MDKRVEAAETAGFIVLFAVSVWWMLTTKLGLIILSIILAVLLLSAAPAVGVIIGFVAICWWARTNNLARVALAIMICQTVAWGFGVFNQDPAPAAKVMTHEEYVRKLYDESFGPKTPQSQTPTTQRTVSGSACITSGQLTVCSR